MAEMCGPSETPSAIQPAALALDELHAALLGDRLRQRRLAGTRRADQQGTAVDLRPRQLTGDGRVDVGDEVLGELARLAQAVAAR